MLLPRAHRGQLRQHCQSQPRQVPRQRLFEAEALDAESALFTPYDTYYNIFCQLKAYFLQHVRKYPDPYDPLLEHALAAIPAPASKQTDQRLNEQRNPGESFCRLFNYVWRYVCDFA